MSESVRDLATLIFHQMEYFHAYPDRKDLVKKEIEALLREWGTELRNEALEKMGWGDLEKEAKAAAYEDAAKIAGNCNVAHDCEGAFIANLIRSRASELAGGGKA